MSARLWPFGLLVSILSAGLGAVAVAQLTDLERRGLDQALYIGNMTARNLEWSRDVYPSAFKLKSITDISAKPLDGSDRLLGIHRKGLEYGPGQLLRLIRFDLLAEPSRTTPPANPRSADLESLPEPLRQPVKDILVGMKRSDALIRAALAQLTSDERRTLIEGLPQLASGELLKFEFISGQTRQTKAAMRLLEKVDLPMILLAGELLVDSTASAIPALRLGAKRSRLDGPVKQTMLGLMVSIRGKGSDVHSDRDAALTIDLGGDDRYTGRAGAGIGACSVLIDLGGNDTYDVGDLSTGAGLLGIGLAYDLGGNDTRRGGSLTFGAGLAGVGVFVDVLGDDTYQAKGLTQGFGMFGAGICIDTEGRDRYQGGLLCQGAARTGGVGWLIDRKGDDTYRAGGLVRSTTMPDAFVAMAQGYGGGYREEEMAGGIGLLSDGAGDDVYIAGAYAQAAGSWLALGSLYDRSGQDTYAAYHFAQGCGLSGSAFLFDLSGDDEYVVKQGASQGLGHDYGIGMLLDRSGNDQYSSASARPGSGNAAGLGILLDASGDDRYASMPAFGGDAAGLFADLGGEDVYGSASGPLLASRGGTAIDLEVTRTDREATPIPRRRPTPGSRKLSDDAALETTFANAGLDERALDDLIAMGQPAFQWLVIHKLATANTAQIDLLSRLVVEIGEPARSLIASKVSSGNLDEARAALKITAQASVEEAAPFIPAALEVRSLQRLAAAAAGVVRSRQSTVQLIGLAASDDKLLVREALLALAQIKDSQCVGTAQALLASSDLMVRQAAIELIAQFPGDAAAVAARMIDGADERTIRLGLQVLGRVGGAEALRQIGQSLSAASPGVRIQALVELSGRVPAELKERVEALRQDPNALVRTVAARAKIQD